MDTLIRKRVTVLGGLIALVLAVTVSGVSAETLMMPNRDALKGTSVVVWGVTTLPNTTSTYTIDFGDGSLVATGIVSDRSYIALNHTYTAEGNRTATLTVVNGATTETATVALQVFDSALLTADNLRSLGRMNMATLMELLRHTMKTESSGPKLLTYTEKLRDYRLSMMSWGGLFVRKSL